MKLNSKQNKVKNQVLEHISICYETQEIGIDVICEIIDSVFYFQNNKNNKPKEKQTKLK